MALTQGRNISLTIGSAIAAPGVTTDFKTLLDAVGTNEVAFEPLTKEIEFKEPEVTTNEVKLLGSTGGNQNQELDPQSPTKGEFTGTLIFSPDDDNGFDLEAFKLTASSVKASAYDFRYNYAAAPPSAGVAVVIQINNGSGNVICNFLLNNATVETLGGVKVDADGHATQDIRVSAAASDCWKEWDANGGT